MAKIKLTAIQKLLTFINTLRIECEDCDDILYIPNIKITDQILLDLKTNDIETDLLVLGIEILVTEIDNEVPVELPNSTKIVDEEEVQKTWYDYCTKGRKRLSQDGTEYLLSLGVFDANGNTQMMTWEQAKMYYDSFGNSLLCPKDFLELLQSLKYTYAE